VSPIEHDFTTFNPYTYPISSNSHHLNRNFGIIWRVNSNHTAKFANLRTAEISTPGIVIVGMQQGYYRQRRTIGSFSATADFLVKINIRAVNMTKVVIKLLRGSAVTQTVLDGLVCYSRCSALRSSNLNLNCTFFSLLVMLVILVNCIFMASNREIPKSEYVNIRTFVLLH